MAVMLQRVATGTVRFNLPGLTADGRGVVSGRQMALRFGAMDRLVSFLRIVTAAQHLDDVTSALRIVTTRAAHGPREVVVLMPSTSTAFADVVARAARTAGGQAFTGAGRHFVRYRDGRSPLGYDAPAASAAEGEFLLYDLENTAAYTVESEIPLSRLILRLGLRRVDGGDMPAREMLYLTVRRGLGPVVAQHLHEAGAKAGAALCEPAAEGLLGVPGALWLFRVEEVPPRLLPMLAETPGLELYRPVAPYAAVAVGYRHPIHLEACAGVFPPDRLLLFSPRVAGAIVIEPLPAFVPLVDLVRIPAAVATDPEEAATRTVQLGSLSVPLRLESAADASRRAVATLVPWSRAAWLKRLCYALPPTALRGYRVALLERGILVISPGALDGFPFGQLLDFAAPGVLVPVGMRVRPAISPPLLAEELGARDGAVAVILGGGEPPFFVAADQIEALERRVLASVDVQRERVRAQAKSAPPPDRPIDLQNDAVGPMPLWGFRD